MTNQWWWGGKQSTMSRSALCNDDWVNRAKATWKERHTVLQNTFIEIWSKFNLGTIQIHSFK